MSSPPHADHNAAPAALLSPSSATALPSSGNQDRAASSSNAADCLALVAGTPVHTGVQAPAPYPRPASSDAAPSVAVDDATFSPAPIDRTPSATPTTTTTHSDRTAAASASDGPSTEIPSVLDLSPSMQAQSHSASPTTGATSQSQPSAARPLLESDLGDPTDPRATQDKRHRPPAPIQRQHSLLTQALATARGIPQHPPSKWTKPPGAGPSAPPNCAATKATLGGPTALVTASNTLHLPLRNSSNTKSTSHTSQATSSSVTSHHNESLQDLPDSSVTTETTAPSTDMATSVLLTTNTAAPRPGPYQRSSSSTPAARPNAMAASTDVLRGNHRPRFSGMPTTENSLERFEKEVRNLERQKINRAFTKPAVLDDGISPGTTNASERAPITGTHRRETVAPGEEPHGHTNGTGEEGRYSMGPEKMWHIGSGDSHDEERDGHVEKSIAKAMSRAESSNRSRKASHTLGFFRAGLPEEKAKRKDGKSEPQSREAPKTESGGALEALRHPFADGPSLSTGFRYDRIPSPERQRDNTPTTPRKPALTTPPDSSVQPEGFEMELQSSDIKHLHLKKSRSVEDLTATHKESHQGAPSILHRHSTDSVDTRASHEEGDDSTEEKISSALFLPHQDPEGTDEEKCELSSVRRPSTISRVQSRSKDYNSWLVKADEPEPEYHTPPPTPPQSHSSQSGRQVISSVGEDTAMVCDGIALVDKASTLPQVADNKTPTPVPYYSDSQAHDTPVAPKQPLEAIELIPYRHQVGGHTPLWRFSKRAVCKKLNNRENEFYETVERFHRDLLPFLPRYIGVLNVTFQRQPRRKSITKKEGATSGNTAVPTQTPGQSQAESRDVVAAVSESPVKDRSQMQPGHRRISQSISNAPMQIPTVAFDLNRHIIPRSLLQPGAQFPNPFDRVRSMSGSAAVEANGNMKTWTQNRPSLDTRTRSWGATMVNKKLRNDVFNDAFLKQPVTIQKHRKSHRRLQVPRAAGVNQPTLRSAVSDSRLPTVNWPETSPKKSLCRDTLATPQPPSCPQFIPETRSMCGSPPPMELGTGDDVKDVTGTSAPEPETLSDKILSQKRKRRFSGSGLRRKPQVGSETRGDLKYFEEADEGIYHRNETPANSLDADRPVPMEGMVVNGHHPTGQADNMDPFTDQVKIPRPVNPKEAQAQGDSRVEFFLLLEDLTAGMKRPCIMDLKMGTRQYGVDATPKKRESQKGKCARTTSRELGVRVCGLQVWDAKSQSYIFRDKYEGRRLKAGDEFQEALTRFLYNGVDWYSVLRQIPTIIRKLDELERIVRGLRAYRFYAASLLMFYDGDTSTTGGADYDTAIEDSTTDAATDAEDASALRRRKRNKREVDFKIADFANSITASSDVQDKACPPQHPDEPDWGFIRGLGTLRRYFLKIQRDVRAELGIEPLPRAARYEGMVVEEDEGMVSE